MKHKASLLRYLMVSVLVVLSMALCFAGCKDDTQRTITWEVPTQATVKVEGYDELPEKVKDGTQLSFTITCANGYEVDSVKNSGKNVTARNGKYTVSITADTTITVSVKQQIKSVNVTANPTKLTYLAGESLDKAGMAVEVEYVSGDKQTLQEADYRIVYPTSSATAFYRGDASFKVSYQGKESADVALTAPVEAKVTINPVAGKIAESVITAWQNNEALHEFAVAEETGIVSFTYAELSEPITLPTGNNLPKRDDLGNINFTFVGWAAVEGDTITGLTSITVENRNSLEIEAQYNADLVTFKAADLKMVGEVPTLEVTFTAEAMSGAYLFLYEGNQKFSVKGDAVTQTSGDIKVDFDLRKLAAAKSEDGASFAGAWMDIRIALDVNGATFSNMMVIDPENVTVDVGKMIHDDDYCYRFIHYVRAETGEVELKVYYNRYAYTYEMEISETGGTPTLTFTGTLNKKLDPEFNYDGADVSIALGSYAAAGKVNADGTWTATLDLSTITENTNATAGTITVTSGSTSLDALYVESSSGNKTSAGNNRNYSTSFSASNGWRYTIGTDWNEPFLTATDVAHEIAVKGDVALKAENNKAYYVVTVQAGANYTEANLKSTVWFGDGSDYINPEKVNSLGSEMYELWFNITEREANGSKLYVHLKIGATAEEASGWDGGNGDIKDADNSENGKFVIVGEKKYSISNEWNMPNLVVDPYDPNTDYTLTSADLVVDGNKVYLVVGGTMPNATDKTKVEEFLTAIYADMQRREGGWDRTKLTVSDVQVSADGKTWSLRLDVTDLEVDVNAYTGHFGSTDGVGGQDTNTKDLKVPAEGTEDGKSVTLGGKKYTLVNKYGSSAAEDNWGCVSVKVEEATAE